MKEERKMLIAEIIALAEQEGLSAAMIAERLGCGLTKSKVNGICYYRGVKLGGKSGGARPGAGRKPINFMPKPITDPEIDRVLAQYKPRGMT